MIISKLNKRNKEVNEIEEPLNYEQFGTYLSKNCLHLKASKDEQYLSGSKNFTSF